MQHAIAEPGERLHRNQTIIEATVLEALQSWGGSCILRDFYRHIARARVSVTSSTFHAILDSMESRILIKTETADNGSLRYWLAGPRKANRQTTICF
jgi:hypothetical protein